LKQEPLARKALAAQLAVPLHLKLQAVQELL